jgi:hypothetical protein
MSSRLKILHFSGLRDDAYGRQARGIVSPTLVSSIQGVGNGRCWGGSDKIRCFFLHPVDTGIFSSVMEIGEH